MHNAHSFLISEVVAVKKIILLGLLLPTSVIAQMPAGGPDMSQMFMQQLDENKDGKVTLEEFRKPNDAQFAAMDGNKDGAVDHAEITVFSEKMMQRMQQMRQRMQQKSGQ